jgi:hypothetical protein
MFDPETTAPFVDFATESIVPIVMSDPAPGAVHTNAEPVHCKNVPAAHVGALIVISSAFTEIPFPAPILSVVDPPRDVVPPPMRPLPATVPIVLFAN